MAPRLQLLLIWILALVAAATVCHLLARNSLRGEGAGMPRTSRAPEPDLRSVP